MSEFLSNLVAALVLLGGFVVLVVLVRRDTFVGSRLVPRDGSGERLGRDVGRD